MRLYSKAYLVTYVTLKGEINSSVYGITQPSDEISAVSIRFTE